MATRYSTKPMLALCLFLSSCGAHSPLAPSAPAPSRPPVYVVIGDSIAMGETYQQYQLPPTVDAMVYRKDHAWKRADDPTDRDSDRGSFWPLVIPSLPAHSKWVTIAQGGTTLHITWQPGQAVWLTGRSVSWEAMNAYIAESGIDHVTAFVCHLGANDVAGDYPLTTESAFDDWRALVSGLNAEWPGATVYVADLGTVTTGVIVDRDARMAAMRGAIERAWTELPTVRRGPLLRDLTPDDGVHFRSDASARVIAQRWAEALTR